MSFQGNMGQKMRSKSEISAFIYKASTKAIGLGAIWSSREFRQGHRWDLYSGYTHSMQLNLDYKKEIVMAIVIQIVINTETENIC